MFRLSLGLQAVALLTTVRIRRLELNSPAPDTVCMRCISIDSANGLMGVTGCKRCLMNVLSHTIRVLGIRTNSHCLPAASDASCAAAAAGPPHPMASCSDAAAALVLGCQLQQPCRAAVDPGKQSVRHCVRPSVRTAVHNSAPKKRAAASRRRSRVCVRVMRSTGVSLRH